MNIKFAEYWIEYDGEYYILIKDGDKMLTPAKNDIKHHNRKLIEHIIFELECETELDVSVLSNYTLYSALEDLVKSKPNIGEILSKEVFRIGIINDPVLRACAGPEKTQQFKKFGDLFSDLELLNLDYPNIIQNPDIEEVEKWIQDNGETYSDSINKFVNHYYAEFNMLSDPQKTIVINGWNLHGSLIYAIILASRKCTELNYITAVLAGHCLLPNVFADVDTENYKESFEGLKSDAHIFTNFIECCLTPDIKLEEFIKTEIPSWGFLPAASKISLIEGLSKIHEAKSEDYSPYVMLMGKSLEIVLKTNVFDEFQVRFNYFFQEEVNIKIFIKSNEIIKNLAKYLVKEPHFIELGSMLYILEKEGGKNASRNEVLRSFFEFIKNELKQNKIFESDWIRLAKDLSSHRNNASHAKRYSLEEATKVKELTIRLLKVF